MIQTIMIINVHLDNFRNLSGNKIWPGFNKPFWKMVSRESLWKLAEFGGVRGGCCFLVKYFFMKQNTSFVYFYYTRFIPSTSRMRNFNILLYYHTNDMISFTFFSMISYYAYDSLLICTRS